MHWKVSLKVALYYRDACSIEFEDHLIITGGFFTEITVSIYNDDGWVQDLANLNTGRRCHSCSHYTSDNDLVSNLTSQLDIKISKLTLALLPFLDLAVAKSPQSIRMVTDDDDV